ncbi:Hypothetical protein R9X50_00583800 [Acrodontium crateriforme]|uniref:COP9 signalosome complex subunit 6 n=1 Tax=Acrodontium crateriforme TaxID=150365 RepID=A0AAQ3MAL7_9PEZI|nr:Hypothetical protein R9X50_00583800 [Acrodontium crateriforme]
MAGKKVPTNPLVLTGSSTTILSVQLHPLVLLTISDYITRHTLREQPGPVVGAIIGQQNGRSFTLEHAFECKLAADDKSETRVDSEWFQQRLEQYRDVHKVPALDLVALFMIAPVDGPQAAHVPVMTQVQRLASTDSLMLLLFHPEMVDALQGGRLPISLFESVQELEGEKMSLRFRELTFEVETGEAEMIGVDFVAKGGGNATSVAKNSSVKGEAGSSQAQKVSKGKSKAKEKDEDDMDGSGSFVSVLSPEDEELIATLTAKANAIKMLNQRINLIRSYLTSLPASYLSDSSSTQTPAENTNYRLLRSVKAMLSRLPLLASPIPDSDTLTKQDTSNIKTAADQEKQDVHLTSLLAALTRSVAEAQAMGSKFAIVQREKQNKERNNYNAGNRLGDGRSGFETGFLSDPAAAL